MLYVIQFCLQLVSRNLLASCMTYTIAVCRLWSRCRPGMAQRLGRGIALLFHDRGTRRGWVVSSTPRPHFTSGKDPVPILQVAGWAPVPVWTGGKPRPHRDSIPDRPGRSSVAIPTELPGPPIAVCTVKNSWWWTEELSETCRVLFQKQIWEISASGWFYYKNLPLCTVTWTSDSWNWLYCVSGTG